MFRRLIRLFCKPRICISKTLAETMTMKLINYKGRSNQFRVYIITSKDYNEDTDTLKTHWLSQEWVIYLAGSRYRTIKIKINNKIICKIREYKQSQSFAHCVILLFQSNLHQLHQSYRNNLKKQKLKCFQGLIHHNKQYKCHLSGETSTKARIYTLDRHSIIAANKLCILKNFASILPLL